MNDDMTDFESDTLRAKTAHVVEPWVVTIPDTIDQMFPGLVPEIDPSNVFIAPPNPSATVVLPSRPSAPVTEAFNYEPMPNVTRRIRGPVDRWLFRAMRVMHWTMGGLLAGTAGYGIYRIVTSVSDMIATVGIIAGTVLPLLVTAFIIKVVAPRFAGSGVAAKSYVSGGKTTTAGVAPSLQTSTGDVLTDKWVATMRDPKTKQVVGGWRNKKVGAFCAVGHLLNIDDPNGWKTGSGYNHKSMGQINKKYGKGMIKQVIAMNDNETPLPTIANFVEKKVRKS